MPAPIATALPARVTVPVHSALPLSTDLPEDIDVSDVVADVSDDGVSAPSDETGELAAVVDRAAEHGIKLSIVVLDEDPGRDSQLRDLATEVGAEEGGTVLVLSPSWVGTYSDSISRVLLESGQDRTYTGDAVVSANHFVDEVVESGPPWALFTAVIVAIVVIASAATFFAKSRRASASNGGGTAKKGDSAPGAGTTYERQKP